MQFRSMLRMLAGLVLISALSPAAWALDKVTVAGFPTTLRLPLEVAVALDYFKDEGIEVSQVAGRSSADSAKMLAGGAVDFFSAQAIDGAFLHKQNIDMRGIAMLTNRFANSIVVRKELADKVKGPADYFGRQIGVTAVGSGTWQLVQYVVKSAGLNPDTLNFVGVGVGPIIMGAVKAGRVDIMSYADPENVMLVKEGTAEFLVDMADPATHKRLVGDTYLNNQIIARGDVIRDRPQQVQGFVNALQRAVNFVNENTAERVAEVIARNQPFDKQDKAALVATLKRQIGPSFQKTCVITEEAFVNAMKFPVSVGAIEAVPPFHRLVDNRFAEAAAKKYPPK